jgi:hypothetical protein
VDNLLLINEYLFIYGLKISVGIRNQRGKVSDESRIDSEGTGTG